MFVQTNLLDFDKRTFSQASEVGPTPCDLPVGPTTGPCGPDPPLASLTPRQALEKGMTTRGPYGGHGAGSSTSMADHHNARDGSRRYTYRHALGRPLHKANTGQMQWGEAYREAHRRIWAECIRVLRSGGVFVVNVKNHIRRGEIVRVSEWHAEELQRQGLQLIERVRVECPGMRNGANAGLRVPHEDVWVFKKP